jgi:hypothetical protein
MASIDGSRYGKLEEGKEISWIGLLKRRPNRGQIDGAVTSETSENMIALRQGWGLTSALADETLPKTFHLIGIERDLRIAEWI